MLQDENFAKIIISITIILIAFSWIGYAYIAGAKANRMVLHPIVPLLIISLLIGIKKFEHTRHIVLYAIIFISIWLFVRLQNVFVPFITGFSLAYIVNVLFKGLQNIPLPKGKRLYLSKGIAAIVLILLLLGALSFITFGVVPQLVDQANAMSDGVINFYNVSKDYIIELTHDIENGEYPLKHKLPESWQPIVENAFNRLGVYVQENIPSYAETASQIVRGIFERVSSGFISTMGRISSAFFILVVFIYAIQSFDSLMDRVKQLFPEKTRERIVLYVIEIDKSMRAFLKGQIAVIIIISIISSIAYSIIRVPFALLVGLLAGLCNAIPTVGPIIGGAIAVIASITGFVAGSYSLVGFILQIVLVVGVAFGIQILDNSIISPRIMSSAVAVHPLVVMFAVLLSASIIGIWGAVFAIPGVVIVKGILKVSRNSG